MAPIRSAVDLLVQGELPADAAGRALRIISRQVRQLTRLVDDLMEVSRITTGRIQLKKEPVELAAVVGAAVEASEAAIREGNHHISVISGLPMTVLGDAERLQQCVVNLLTNAAKYTEPGGSITVELLRQEDAGVIRVMDTGVGMAPEFLPFVFDLFVQSDRTLDRAQGGLGIGLSVVKRLVEMHGGSASASSPGLGKGATFEIRLPLASAATVTAKLATAANRRQRLRIVVVDDNEDAADSLAMALQACGHEVRAVYEAQSALEAAAHWRPQAMLVDIGLPGMDGYALAERLRKLEGLQGLRLVALTGYGQEADKAQSAKSGFDGHLVKPAEIEQVLEVLGHGLR
jgi:CheY-like chemotaxis protein